MPPFAMPVFAAAVLAFGLAVTSADAAVTITNRDDKDHKLTILEEEGTKKTDVVLKANQVVDNVCAKGCVIRLNDSEEDEYELEGNEAVSIEEGYLYYDTPEAPATEPPAAPAPKN